MYHRKMEENNIEDAIYKYQVQYKKFTYFTTIVSFIISVFTFFLLQNQTKVVVALTGVIPVLYALPLNKIGIKRRLRDVPYLKIFLIAFNWSATAVLFPTFESTTPTTIPYIRMWHLFVIQFIYLLFITLPFDINDLEKDKVSKTHTIATLFGTNGSKIICGLLFINNVILFNLFHFNYRSAYYFFVALMFFLLIITIFYSDKISKTKIMFFYDGSMILYFIGVAIINYGIQFLQN